MNSNWITIDGSTGEGGGQMLRSSLALSILTRQPVRLKNIRARRPKPGLQAQHLASVQAAASISNAEVTGASIGSQTITFVPQAVAAGDYVFKIGTAGATVLVLHTVYLPLLLQGKAPSTLRIEGGTHALAAPSAEYVIHTWRRYLQAFGADIQLEMVRPGFFPKGGGQLQCHITPNASLSGWNGSDALPTSPEQVECLAILGGRLPRSIGERIIKQAHSRLGDQCEGTISEYPHARSEGVVACIIDKRGPVPSLFTAFGERGKPAEKVTDDVVEEYLQHRDTGCIVDPHGADQILLPLAFAQYSSEFGVSSVTQHLLTHRDILHRFVGRHIMIEGELDQPGHVRIQ